MVVLTALRLEYDAVRRHLTAVEPQVHPDGTYVAIGRLEGAHAPVRVALAEIGPGNHTAAVLTERLHTWLQPEALLFVGVAGGLRDDVRLGDVVVATHVYAYHGGKQTPRGLQVHPRVWEAPYRLLQVAKYALQGDRWQDRVHFKPIAAGEVVLNSAQSELSSQLREHYGDAVAIEMESAGVAQAAHLGTLQTLTVRGISDKADGRKHQADAGGSQTRAAANATEAALAVIAALAGPASGPVPKKRLKPKPKPKLPRLKPDPDPDPDPAPGLRVTAAALTRRLRAVPARRRQVLLPVALLALAGIGAGVAVSCRGGDDGGGSGGTPPAVRALPACGKADTKVRIAASVDMSEILARAAKAYGNRSAGGSCVGIVVDGVNSGTAMRALARGWKEQDGQRPDVWSPAGTAWLSLARRLAKDPALKPFPKSAEPIAQSPLTIAMPEPMARQLGWPEKAITWAMLADWAKHADGFWAQRGKPEWKAFELGKTNPGYSTSGLNATVAAFFAKTGTSGELSVPHIDKSANQKFVKSIEQAAVHYGDTTLTFLANLREADGSSPDRAMSYISAVTLEENTVVAYNAGYPCGALSRLPECVRTGRPRTPLVSFYPKDGVPFSEHPYVELTGMTAAKKKMSAAFLGYLHSPEVYAKQFEPFGFRTWRGAVPKGSKVITQAHGALPGAPITPMPMPGGDVLERILDVWPALRRRANVLAVIDTSESMSYGVPGTGSSKMELLKQAEPALFGEFTGTDRVGLWKFSDADVLGGTHDYKELVPLGPTRKHVLADNVAGLVPEGATGLYDTLDAAVQAMRDDYDPQAINAIVLLTDGVNQDRTSLGLSALLKRIGDTRKPQVRVFTIAYGSGADEEDKGGRSVLEEIAAATGGRAYDAKNARTIDDVITSVISNF